MSKCKKFNFTQEYLKSILDYNKHTGDFKWKIKVHGKNIGEIAGFINGDKYYYITILGKQYKLHRLAYFYTYNEQPEIIDHINRDKLDNSINNLTESNSLRNSRNSKIFSTNTSGFKGVSFHKASDNWISRTCIKGKVLQKYFKSKEDAIKHRAKINEIHNINGI